jgi:hemolysin activation/secretion protein
MKKSMMLSVAMMLLPAVNAQAIADPANREFVLQQERERELRKQQEQAQDVRTQRDEPPEGADHIPASESPCFPISRIVLQGRHAGEFTHALQRVTTGADAAIGRCLGTAGVNAVLARVQNALVAEGYITTRILAAPQDLGSGELILTVIPGRVRKIRFAADADPRGTQWNAIPIGSGDLLNLRAIEQGLENLKRVPTAEADIQIEPADADDAQPGESDLVIQYRQTVPLRLSVSVDDGGSSATGRYQGSATLSYDNWWTLNDLFYFSFNRDLGGGTPAEYGMQAYTAHYSLPFGYWALGFTESSSNYHQAVAGANQTYIYSGQSKNSELKLSRLLYRDALRKTGLSLRGMLRCSSNFIDDTEIEVQRRRTAGWELGLSHREFIGELTLDAHLAYRRGTGAFGAMRAPEEAFGEGTSRYRIVTADLNLSRPMRVAVPWGTLRMRYTTSLRGQWDDTPLTPQDRFSIGGRYSVRGFDGEMTLLAENGWLVRNELGVALGASGQEAYLGLDYGEVGGPSAAGLSGQSLAGAVVGLRGGGLGRFSGFSYEVFAGAPLSKPEHFQTAALTAGFNLSWSY